MRILKVYLEYFKGVREQLYHNNSPLQLIKGRNGLGKSTIGDAVLWVLMDKDYALVSNPNVRPNSALDEVVTKVAVVMDFNGKTVEVEKSQKLKRSKTGTVSLTNSYMINSVPKSEKGYREYMEGLGVNFSHLLMCMHPGVLLAGINSKKERTAIRNLLFEMAADVTDVDVANDTPELAHLPALLEHYDTEEITAMQNNTLRKIRENYGKEGEILRSKIEGLESAKIEIDAVKHQKKLDELNKDLAEKQEQLASLNGKLEYINGIDAGIMSLKFKLNQIEQDAVKDEISRRSKIDNDIFRVETQVKHLQNEITSLSGHIKKYREEVEEHKTFIKINEDEIKKLEAKQFDEGTAVCPTCGQKLPKKKVAELKAKFDENISNVVKRYQDNIEHRRKRANEVIATLNETVKAVKAKSEELKALEKTFLELKQTKEEMGDLPNPDLSGNKEYQDLLKKIKEDEDLITSASSVNDEIKNVNDVIKNIQAEMSVHQIELAKVEQNKRIDDQIFYAKNEQKDYEQAKADAEEILHELSLLNMKKNELLQESVNKNFNIISWRLYSIQKNGEIKDACIPMIGDKVFGTSMNTGLETLARIDALCGIQKYFGYDYPIILDNAEHLDSESIKKIQTDHQLIMLMVSEDKELVFE